ncbi:MAG: tagaturonate reductase [Eubacterium sp.]|nr:tagaturonate reductase [Eubacterium sp.]
MKNIREYMSEKGSSDKTEGKKVKILQFGEGNFLRGFVDEMIDKANDEKVMNAEVIIVKPRKGSLSKAFEEQNCLYTTSLRGEEGICNRVISCVSEAYSCYDDYDRFMELAKDADLRFIISNTTEAGIVFDSSDKFSSDPPASFPGKLAKFLYLRYKTFEADREKGVVIIPVELIDDNGAELKSCILRLADLWDLEKKFIDWIEEACIFCSTLVDRIISGYPAEEAESLWEQWGYKDELIVTGESFGLWVIEPKKDISDEFPLHKAGLPVLYVNDIKPYKKRKVRILNGAHTSFVPAAYLMGYDTVSQAMSDKTIYDFVNGLLKEEVIPTLDMDKTESESFADSVIARFKNPYIRHELSAIALNSISKWKTRCMPAMLDYIDMFGKVPEKMLFSFAALLAFYRAGRDEEGRLVGKRICNGKEVPYEIRDEDKVKKIFENAAVLDIEDYVKRVMSEKELWGRNLSEAGLSEQRVACLVKEIAETPRRALSMLLSNAKDS